MSLDSLTGTLLKKCSAFKKCDANMPLKSLQHLKILRGLGKIDNHRTWQVIESDILQ